MLRNRRLSQRKFIYNVAADAGFNCKQILQNGYSRRMCQRFRKVSNLVLLIGEEFGLGDSHSFIFILQYYDIIIILNSISVQNFPKVEPAVFPLPLKTYI